MVQFADPSVTSFYDYDRKEAVITRKKAFAGAAAKGYWVGISYSSFPGIGHISSDGKKFKFIPINYSSSGVGQ